MQKELFANLLDIGIYYYLVFVFGLRRRINDCRWCEIFACAEHFLDFIDCFAFGFRNDENHKECSHHTEHREQPECIVYLNSGYQ